MERLLLLRGEERHCADCGTTTVFVPVEEGRWGAAWVCTACDGAVLVPGIAA